jgi:putative cardiolipin synthase
MAMSGWASLPESVFRVSSLALPPSPATLLGSVAVASSTDTALTGSRLLPSSPFALNARLELARLAERSLDVQCYLIASDGSGANLLAKLA